jgi:hypothetical protein
VVATDPVTTCPDDQRGGDEVDRHHPRPESASEYRLSSESAREVADRAGPPPGSRRFLSTDHLSTEAVAAYVDRRLPAAGQTRAEAHLARCPRCRREVAEQHDARRALRGSGPIHMPADLRDRLRSLGEGPPPDVRPTEDHPDGRWAGLFRRLRGRGR